LDVGDLVDIELEYEGFAGGGVVGRDWFGGEGDWVGGIFIGWDLS